MKIPTQISFDVVTVAYVDDEERVGNSLVEIFDAEDCSRYESFSDVGES